MKKRKITHIYRHWTKKCGWCGGVYAMAEDGYVQRADAFVPHNMQIGRIAFWPAIA